MTTTLIDAHVWWRMTDEQRLNWYAGYVGGVQDAILDIELRPEPDEHYAHGYERGYNTVHSALKAIGEDAYYDGYNHATDEI